VSWAADEIERRKETYPYSELDMDMHVEAVTKEMRAALGQLLDAHWPLVETADHEDANCKRAREALNIHNCGERGG
jgi:hypothetical protein